MARRGEQSDRMMRASESGFRARARAQEGLTDQRTRGSQAIVQQGLAVTNAAIADQRRIQQDEQFASAQATQVAERQKDRELSGAKAGLEYQTREERLKAEMARGEEQGRGAMGPDEQGPPIPTGPGALDPESQKRVADQAGRPQEMDGGKWVPNAASREAAAAERDIGAFKAQTERIKAEAYRDQVATSRTKALLSNNTEKVERLTMELQQPIISNTQRLDRFQKGEPTGNDWDSMAKMAEGFSAEPQLMADIEAKQWTPRVRQFLSMQINKDALKFIGYTGTFPDAKKTGVDMGSPIMQQFTSAVGTVNGWMRSMPPGLSSWMGIRSYEDKIQFQNRMAAAMTLSGMMQEQQQGQGAFGNMAPSAGVPVEPAPAGPPTIQQEGEDWTQAADQDLARQRMERQNRPAPPPRVDRGRGFKSDWMM